MTWQEMKDEKRRKERERRERRDHWNGLRREAAKGNEAAKLVLARIASANNGKTVLVGNAVYAVDESGTYRRTK